tara:strand:+ start:13552 stop:14313 length:762 start_codon:yes stop_codon:yes gene_type:complete
MKKKSETAWELFWSDEFDGDTLDSKFWNRQVEEAGRFNEEWQRYTDSIENAYIENSCLVIKAIHEKFKHGKNNYTSARLNTAQKLEFSYGKISSKIKLPHGNGIWPAFWMLGANIDENGGDTPWPFTGEIDILELFGSTSNSKVEANLHYADKKGNHNQMGMKSYHLSEGKFADTFHVFELEWNDKEFIWSVDGSVYAKQKITDSLYKPFHKDFFLLLNIAVGGEFTGCPDATTIFPQKMFVDWIRIYKKISL